MPVLNDVEQYGPLLGIHSENEEVVKHQQCGFWIFFMSVSYVPFSLAPFSLFMSFGALA